jgi:hypothetical protein
VALGAIPMAIPRITPDEVAHFGLLAADYIRAQRTKYLACADPMSDEQRAAIKPFFLPEMLDGTRLVVLRSEKVVNPDFYPMLEGMGFRNLPDQSTMAAITVCDVVVSHQQFTNQLLFHELVHVEQYRQLGIARFAELYVRGFLTGGSYEAIPLEVSAYTLERRFKSHPRHVFSVEAEVKECLARMAF